VSRRVGVGERLQHRAISLSFLHQSSLLVDRVAASALNLPSRSNAVHQVVALLLEHGQCIGDAA